MARNLLLKSSMEAIHFQDGLLGAKMEFVVGQLSAESKPTHKFIDEKLTELEKIIFDSLGLTVNFLNTNMTMAAVYTPTVIIDHIFNSVEYNDFYKQEVKKMLKLAELHKNTSVVDLKNSRISGVFSKIKSNIYICFPLLFSEKSPFTIKEVVSIILHELGHLFTVYEYANRTIATNQALSIVSKALMEKDSVTEFEHVLEEVGYLISKDKHAFRESKQIKDQRVLTTIIVDKCREQAKSELGTSFYDYTIIEYVADQFVSRHGYGRHLITALDKSNNFEGSFSHHASNGHFADIATITKSVLTMAFGIASFAFISPFIGFLFGLMMYSQVSNTSFLSKDFTYDDLKVRFKRIREQNIEYIKQKHISDEDRQKTLATLDETKQIIDGLVIYEPIYQRLFNFISKKNRDAKAAYDLQRDLEELASNELFVKAAQLSTLQK